MKFLNISLRRRGKAVTRFDIVTILKVLHGQVTDCKSKHPEPVIVIPSLSSLSVILMKM